MDRIWLLGVAAVGIVLGGAAQDLTVSVLSSPKTVEPGDLVTHVFSLANESAVPLEVALEADLPSGWVSLGLPQTLTIPAGQEEVVFLTAAVPGDAPAGDYTLSLRARWDEKEAQATAQVRVASVVALEVLAPRGKAVPPGQAARYTFQVINRGNVVDRAAWPGGTASPRGASTSKATTEATRTWAVAWASFSSQRARRERV